MRFRGVHALRSKLRNAIVPRPSGGASASCCAKSKAEALRADRSNCAKEHGRMASAGCIQAHAQLRARFDNAEIRLLHENGTRTSLSQLVHRRCTKPCVNSPNAKYRRISFSTKRGTGLSCASLASRRNEALWSLRVSGGSLVSGLQPCVSRARLLLHAVRRSRIPQRRCPARTPCRQVQGKMPSGQIPIRIAVPSWHRSQVALGTGQLPAANLTKTKIQKHSQDERPEDERHHAHDEEQGTKERLPTNV